MIDEIIFNLVKYSPNLIKALKETLIMVSISGLFATLFGIPIGIILATTNEQGLLKNKVVYSILSKLINTLRSIPFAILVASIPWLVRAIVNTTIGVKGAIVPLIIASTPFMARQVELALSKVDKGVIEAYQAMGFSNFDIILKVLLKEGQGGIIQGVTLSLVSLVGFSAIAGTVGGGGLGDFALRYGYSSFNPYLMFITLVIIIALVFIIQWVGDLILKEVVH
ncbi:MAG: ABC transporter permease [Erysipelotrichaceae bacterium]|nr:ABC transporter permease [Erysipelotrichaceae bacterium]